jgi:hypothetical protein
MSFLNPSKADTRRRRLIGGVAALAITGVVMFAFLIENQSGYLPPDKIIIYAESWKGDRSREDAVKERELTVAAREAKLAEARAYIATLSGEKKIAAQKQYDDYVNGGGARKEIPYISASEPPMM